jgi:hypothetical protein
MVASFWQGALLPPTGKIHHASISNHHFSVAGPDQLLDANCLQLPSLYVYQQDVPFHPLFFHSLGNNNNKLSCTKDGIQINAQSKKLEGSLPPVRGS